MANHRHSLSDVDADLLAILVELAKEDRNAYRTLRKAAWEHVVDRFSRGEISINSKNAN